MELRVWLLGLHVSAEQLSNRKNDKVYPVKQMACQLHPAQGLQTSEAQTFHSWLSPRQTPFAQQFMYKSIKFIKVSLSCEINIFNDPVCNINIH